MTTANDLNKQTIDLINYRGGFACFARSIDDVVEFLDSIDKYEAERNGSPVIPF